MNNKQIIDITKDKDLYERKELILLLMRQQKRMFDGMDIPYTVDIEKCSLYDLQTCTIVGSGVCSRCNGLIGRAPDYENEY